jgi:hypothetical protein
MLKLNRCGIILFILCITFLISSVSAEDLDNQDISTVDGNYSDLELDSPDVTSVSGNSIYVNDASGDDSNDGKSEASSLKSFQKALEMAGDDDSIYISDGNYSGLKNTRITIDKSVNIIGSSDTTFDGLDSNFIFKIADNAKVTFKNIRFVNSFKQAPTNNPSSMYGGALEIGKATVTIDTCSFIKNSVVYDSSINKFNYGGAISNFGHLTITDSYFDSNIATSTSGLFSYGGAIYNNGTLLINSTVFNNSRAIDFGYGGAIYNDADLVIDNSIFSNSVSTQECKASVIFNAGNCTLSNSIIENNTIARASFYYIYGAIYNYGYMKCYGNIFRNNLGVYEAPNPEYRGSPTIFNVGDLDMTYNAFMDNAPFNGIASDVYINGGKIISLDDNWWSTNENPFRMAKINVDEQINSWFVFNLSPEYTALDIGQSVDIMAFWSLSSSMAPRIDIFPVMNVTFTTVYAKVTQEMINGQTAFSFDYTQNRGLYEVTANIGGYNQKVLVDVGKIASDIHVDVTDNVSYIDDIILNVVVTGDDGNTPTGNVSVVVGKTTYVINLTDGRGFLNISNLDPDDYTFKIAYEGSDSYFKSFENVRVIVNKAKTDLSVVFPDIKVDQKGIVTVTLGPEGVQGQAYLYINGVRKKILYLYNGNTTVPISNFAEGEYNVTVDFWGTKYYEAASASTTFRVSKYDASLKINVSDIHIGENQTIRVISDYSNLGEATLIINGVSSTVFLDSKVTEISINGLGYGTYDVELFYPENPKYHAAYSSASFRVLRTFTSLSVDIAEDGFKGVITVRTNYTDCTGEIGIYINYDLYLLNLSNGVARFDVNFYKGANYIYVFYDGDDNYEGATWNTTWGVAEDFILMGHNATGFEHNDFDYEVRLIEYNGIPMPGRTVSVFFDGNGYDVTTDSEGIARFLLNLNAGSYEIYATYKNQTVYNGLTVKEITFNVTAENITYGDNSTVEVEFERNLTGNANLFIENVLNVTVKIVDGKASYNVSGLKVGEYEVIARYVNDHFTSDVKKADFGVIKANPVMDAEIDDIVYGTDGIITVTLPSDAAGEVVFVVDGVNQSETVNEGVAQIVLSNMEKGIHNVSVIYNGDSNYNSACMNSTFSVKDKRSDVMLSVGEAKYGENITVVAILDENATGDVLFNVSNITQLVRINDGVANWTFTGLNAGNHVITAKYLGDKTFISSRNSTAFNVSKADSSIEINVGEVYLNENILIYAVVSPNATGSVLFSIPYYYTPRAKPISDSIAVWYISPLGTGSYKIIASYAGDNNYNPSDVEYVLNVTQRKSVLSVEIADAGINDRVTAYVKLASSDGEAIDGVVKLSVGTKSYNLQLNKGSATLVIGKIAPGNYTYTAVYEGNDNFSKASVKGSFKVVDDLLELKLIAKNLTLYYGNNKYYVVKAVDEHNKPISGIDLVITVGSTVYYETTDENGEVSIPANFAVGNHNVKAVFNENQRYHASSITTYVQILSTLSGVDVTSEYGVPAEYFAMFSDSNGKALSNREVTFTIGDKSYTAKTYLNGVCKLSINFPTGRYTISVTNPATGQKITNTLYIFKKLMENEDVSIYYGDSGVYKVRAYDNKGNPVGEGMTVTFNVNGKTYDVKTDSNGYAVFKINLKPNNYRITATYDGFSVVNNIVVKPVLTATISVKKGKIIKVKAKLLNSKGKVLKGKKIKVKFKGKTYKMKTNKKGIAKLKIKKKLKVGRHKITIKYGKSTITKIIRIRK